MPKYFALFPTTIYNLADNNTGLDVVTNILSKFSFEESFKSNTVVYYKYMVGDGETPDMVASKVYNDSEKHWIILALNNIVDLNTDWPVEQGSLINVMDSKYYDNADTANTNVLGSQWAQGNIKSYYKVVTQTNVINGKSFVNAYEIDADAYANVASSSVVYTLQDGTNVQIDTAKDIKTYYDYEIESNETKRIIKLLKPEFVSAVEAEFKRVIA